MRSSIRHGIALGQFRGDLDFDALAHLIHGAFWYRFLSGTVMPLDDAYAHQVVVLLRPAMETEATRRARLAVRAAIV